MTVMDDFVAEALRLQGILGLLTQAQWQADSRADGWSVADVVLHLAQSDEAVAASADGADHRGGRRRGGHRRRLGGADGGGGTDRARPGLRPVARGARHRRGGAPGGRPGAAAAVGGRTDEAGHARRRRGWRSTGRTASTSPSRSASTSPTPSRLRHIAWLAHRTLPYALSRAGEAPAAVRCSLTAPDEATTWTFGPDDADSEITGSAGAFCRVAAQRLDPADSGLRAAGPHGAAALRVVRTYA